MFMTQQQFELHVSRLRNAPHVFAGVIALDSRGAVVFCASGWNTGLVNADRDGIEIRRAPGRGETGRSGPKDQLERGRGLARGRRHSLAGVRSLSPRSAPPSVPDDFQL